ncbi:ABC transporter ATP-binding protein [Staphylococcus kloosii]|jgi:ABC-2 type transport system ATP-binding protein|uniref:ABC transporter ATP-binding protein n=1 Tax=Staphylococcus kloosii TaxID=29384 RepID=UPI00189E506B|nr:ABC transporter ATP-binding protein [Staphylococcus kloosii]MBF7020818.1 ABC transporter ATP-binding protein [Staphylococcus kloosii]
MILKSISKSYGNEKVLDELSLTLNKNEVVGLIGRNGVGKSTLMKIITQLDKKFTGNIEGNEDIGYLIEEPKLYNNKTGMEHLKYFSSIYNNNFDLEQYNEFLQNLQMLDVLNKKVKRYSLGMKQKLGILISILNNPSFIILDEPTNSMDIETSSEVLNELKNISQKQNIGILISSHKLEDIEEICDRFLFLKDGKISREETKNSKNINIINLAFIDKSDLEKFESTQKFGQIISNDSNTLKLKTKHNVNSILKHINEYNIELKDIFSEKQTLRDIYIKESGGSKIDSKH